MPLSVMNAAIEAQERFYQLEELTHMGAGYSSSPSHGGWAQTNSGERKVSNSLQNQQRIYSSKIIRQLEMRGLVKLEQSLMYKYLHHISDFMVATAHLSPVEECFYRRALDFII